MKKKNNFKIIDLFCGLGGLRLGFEKYGCKTVFSSDIDRYSQKIYELNFKEAKNKFEKEYLIQKLRSNNWNMTLTAKNLNLDRVSLYRKVKSLGINIE